MAEKGPKNHSRFMRHFPTTLVYSMFSIKSHFSMILLCLLNSNQLHLMDQTTLKRIVVITLFMLHLFDCLIVICTIQQMTLLS